MLPYDKIPAERRHMLGYAGRLGDEGHAGLLGVYLAQWAAREDFKADPEATKAGHGAVETIDAMLRDLHELRSRLVSEIRERQDINARRVDAELAARA